MGFDTPASVVDGYSTLIFRQNLTEFTSQALKDWRAERCTTINALATVSIRRIPPQLSVAPWHG